MLNYQFRVIAVFFVLSMNAYAEYIVANDPVLMCGPNALWLTARISGVNSSIKELRYLAETNEKGTSLNGMLRALEKIGLDPVVVKADWNDIGQLNTPMIALFKTDCVTNHYVFVKEVKKNTALILDPPHIFRMSEVEFKKHYYGYVIIPSKKKANLISTFNAKIDRIGTLIVIFLSVACVFSYILKSRKLFSLTK